MKYIQRDNVIGKHYLSRLYNILSRPDGNFPWFFLSEDVSYTASDDFMFGSMNLMEIPDIQKAIGFTHVLLDSDGSMSPYYSEFAPLLDNIKDQFNGEINFFRARLALQLNNGKDSHNAAHTDSDRDHYAALFYFHDSSGDTVFMDQYDDPASGDIDQRWFKARTQKYTIQKRVTPKANRLFAFDGHQFHSSSNPTTNNFRIILNLNFTSDDDLFATTDSNDD